MAAKWKKKYKCKVIPVQAEKGGVGKTTISINLATRLAEHYGKKVLLIDLDEQCNSGFDIGLSTENLIKLDRLGKCCSNLFRNTNCDMSGLVLGGLIPEIPNFYFLPSTFSLMFTERWLQDRANDSFEAVGEESDGQVLCTLEKASRPEARTLRVTFNNNAEFLNRFDYVILDCKPSISHINESALAVADSLIVVTDPSYNSMLGVETFYNFWELQKKRMGLETDYETAIIMNRFKSRGSVDREIEAILKGDFDYPDMPEYAKQLFEGYDQFYVDQPIPERSAFTKRSSRSVPLVITPDSEEKKILATVLDPLIEKLFERGIL